MADVFELNYDAPPTLSRFMESDKRVRLVRGPVGSGKSTAMVMELLRRATEQVPDPRDGVRRTRAAIVRNTLPQLKDTCLKTIQARLGPLVDYRVSERTVYVKAGDVESEWILMPLDTPDDVKRLLSLDLTFAWLSELRELPVKILLDVLSRCGRYPAVTEGGPTWRGVIGETNSFDSDCDWYKVLEEKELEGKPLPGSWDYFVQPGAFDPGAENREFLVSGYYEDLLDSSSFAWAEQYVHNKIAPALSGEAVFASSFKESFHVSAAALIPVPSTLAVVGMDFGRNPAALISQIDPRGRLIILDEVFEENMGVELFVNTKLKPLFAKPEYMRIPVGVVGDPSGIARTQIGEESVFQALHRLGLSAQPAMTNAIDPRLRSVEKWLTQQREGGGAILISPKCVNLIAALRSKYRYAKKKDGELQALPEKKHPWSDLADALQYTCLGHTQAVKGRLMRVAQDRKRQNGPALSMAGFV